MKEYIPEYRETYGAAADAVHKESSDITASVINEFLEGSMKGINVIVPTIGDDFDKLMSKYIRPFEEAGYTVRVKYVECEVNISFARNIMRELETGRIINSSIVLSYGTKPLETYKALAVMTDPSGEVYGLTVLSDAAAETAEIMETAETTEHAEITETAETTKTAENPATGTEAPAVAVLFIAVPAAVLYRRHRRS